MPLFAKILLCLLLPLIWGLGVEHLFERARRRKQRAATADEQQESPR